MVEMFVNLPVHQRSPDLQRLGLVPGNTGPVERAVGWWLVTADCHCISRCHCIGTWGPNRGELGEQPQSRCSGENPCLQCLLVFKQGLAFIQSAFGEFFIKDYSSFCLQKDGFGRVGISRNCAPRYTIQAGSRLVWNCPM